MSEQGDLEAKSGQNVCDFCSPPRRQRWIYPCKSFRLPGPEVFGRFMWSNGPWAACVKCGALIEGNDRDELARQAPLNPLQRQWIDKFFDNRDGDRKLAGTGPSEAFGATVFTPGTTADIPESERYKR